MRSRSLPLAEQQPGDEEPGQHEEGVERQHAAAGEVAGVHRDGEPDGEAAPPVERGPVRAAGARVGASRRQWFARRRVGMDRLPSVAHEDRDALAAGGGLAHAAEPEPPHVQTFARGVARASPDAGSNATNGISSPTVSSTSPPSACPRPARNATKSATTQRRSAPPAAVRVASRRTATPADRGSPTRPPPPKSTRRSQTRQPGRDRRGEDADQRPPGPRGCRSG